MENTLRHQQPYTDFSRIIRVKSEYIKEGQKIMDDKKVARINELYHKSKAEGLTPEELKEQQILRKLDIRSSVSEKRWIRLCGNRPPILSRKQ